MQHSFDVDIATKYGITEAIILNHLYFWIIKNKANNDNYNDGFYWTYNSITAYCELFPYLSRKKISGALSRLEDAGLIITGNYNKVSYDRTKWYTLTELGLSVVENGKSIVPKGKMESAKKENGISQKEQTIPDINTIIKPNNNKRGFTPPTIEEVRNYCRERNNNINAEAFIDFYTSKDWYVGKNKMKDWKASVRTWERRNEKTPDKKINSFCDFNQREYDTDEIERKALMRRL